jgi:PleD family two-component response regulator
MHFNYYIVVVVTEVTGEDTIDTVLKRAGDALYKAKSKGKNCIVSD